MGLFSKKKKEIEVVKNEVREQKTAENTWICPKCQSTNSLASRNCRDCGYYR